jgi:hypothetical protein
MVVVTVFENDDCRVLCEAKHTHWGSVFVSLMHELLAPEHPKRAARLMSPQEREVYVAMANAIAERFQSLAADMQVGGEPIVIFDERLPSDHLRAGAKIMSSYGLQTGGKDDSIK